MPRKRDAGAGGQSRDDFGKTTRRDLLSDHVADLIKSGLLPGSPPTPGRTPGKENLLVVLGGSKYRLTQLIAKGGMGAVYEAWDLACRRKVAVKFMPDETSAPKEDLLRFIHEAQITSRLGHPNIMPIYELGTDERRRVFYVMKLVEGETLTDVVVRLRQGEPRTVEDYPLNRLLVLFGKVCDAMAFAHSRGVIHRDLKPDNILVGSFGEVLITDWGLAKLVAGEREADAPPGAERETAEPRETEWPVSRAGQAVGSPGFMSPEQASGGREEVGCATDIFSLGAMLYTMLTLQIAVREQDMREYVRVIRSNDIPPPIAFNDPSPSSEERRYRLLHCPDGKIPAALSAIAMKAMAGQPADRYASIRDLQRDLEDFQNGLAWNLVVESDFERPGALDDWHVAGGEHEVKAGLLRIRHGQPHVLLLRRDVPGDVRIDFEGCQFGGYLSDLGFFMSAVPSGNLTDIPASGYRLVLGAHDNSQNVVTRTELRLWGQPASPLVSGKTFHIIAERVGRHLGMTVNGDEVFNVADPDPLAGAERVAVGLTGWGAETRVRRLRVYQRTSPSRADVLDLADLQLQRGRFEAARQLYTDVLESSSDAARSERARAGIARTERHEMLTRDLPRWLAQLEKAWPGRRVQLRIDNAALSADISGLGISDLSPLKGLPLTSLYCSFNSIASLEPLRGMPLAALFCNGNPIDSLDPLHGMKLEALFAEGCRVKSLEPLRGMPLASLNVARNRIASLEPLRGMKLNSLYCFTNEITSLAPLEGMPLTSLLCQANTVVTMASLKGMALTTLNCSNCGIRSLEPLQGVSLTVLHCGENEIESLDSLAGMPLTILTCHANRIRSLQPLKGMPLVAVVCGGNPIASLAPFVAQPPGVYLFDGDGVAVSELNSVRETWSRDFRSLPHARSVSVCLALREKNGEKLKALAGEFAGHRYLHVPKWLTWQEARAFCERLGGHLVTISSLEENRFVESQLRGGWVWMGLETVNGRQTWITGEPAAFLNFADPLQAALDGPKIFDGKWHAESVRNAVNTFVIEWDA